MSDRSLIFVAGSGRSGTSLFSGMLQRLGYHVPQPEVPADDTNPKGFAESQWVVDFHTRLLRRAGVQVSDARPAAWAQTAQVTLDEEVEGELRTWLEDQYRQADHLIIKDPRLSWFLPLWRRVAEGYGVQPRFVTMLRHPAAVIASKQRWYGGWQGEAARCAGWVNFTLYTERATRDAPRVFVHYEDLLDDWTKTIGHVGEVLDLSVVREASAQSMREVHDFVDRSLSRSSSDWEAFRIPTQLRGQADEVWSLVSGLAKSDGVADAETVERLEAARAAYVALYEESEAIAQSSIAAAQRTRSLAAATATRRSVPIQVRLAQAVPSGLKARVPLSLKRRVLRALKGQRRPKVA
jgi:hypothetical protein